MRYLMGFLFMAVISGVCAQDTVCSCAAGSVKSYVWVKENSARQEPLLQEIAAFLEKEGYFYLATCDLDSPRVRPIKYVFIVDNKLLFVTSAKKGTYQQLMKNHKVELSRTAADKQSYLRFKGSAELCNDPAIKAKLIEMEPLFSKKFGDDQAIFLVKPEMAGIFPMKAGEPKTKCF